MPPFSPCPALPPGAIGRDRAVVSLLPFLVGIYNICCNRVLAWLTGTDSPNTPLNSGSTRTTCFSHHQISSCPTWDCCYPTLTAPGTAKLSPWHGLTRYLLSFKFNDNHSTRNVATVVPLELGERMKGTKKPVWNTGIAASPAVRSVDHKRRM